MIYTYYGHSCFSISQGECTILVDPFITGNALASHINIQDIKANYILLSHGHADHIMDCEAIALRTGAKVVCSWEIHEWLQAKGVSNTHPMNTGGSWNFGDIKIRCTVAQHSSGLPDGSYGGNPMGFIIEGLSKTIYYSGDTALTLDMQLIPTWANIDVAVLPIGNNFTMDANDAIRAADMVKCKKVIGVHYDTFGYIVIDKQATEKLFHESGINLLLLEIGSSIEL